MAFANFSLTTVYATLISMLNTQLTAVAKLFKDQTTGDFVDQVRYNSSTKKLESWDGNSWEPLDLTGTAAGSAASANSSAVCSGNAATATALQNARNIGGVPFNGSADINLPGVNAAGNQNTSGSAATAVNSSATGTIPTTRYENGLRIIRGNITGSTGVITAGSGFTASRAYAGSYQINFTNTFSGTPTAVVTAYGPGSNIPFRVNFLGYPINAMTVDAASDQSFCFTVIGPN